MRIFLSLLALLFCFPALAQDVPVISFAQQVDIVVQAKRDPRILEVKIEQDEEDVILNVIVDKSVKPDQIKKLAADLIMLTKLKSLDDKPKKKNIPGKGLYNYQVNMTRPDGINLVSALKYKKKEKVVFEDAFTSEPLTRRGDADDQ